MSVGDSFWVFAIVLPLIVFLPLFLVVGTRNSLKKNVTEQRLHDRLKRCSVCGYDSFEFGEVVWTGLIVKFNRKRQQPIVVKCKKCGNVRLFTEP